MDRAQLEHAIRAACQIIGSTEVIVVGSQSILGTYNASDLPPAATLSIECDILPIAASHSETVRLADLLEGVAGEWSLFEEVHGFCIDGVDLTTVILPPGWRDRLVRVQNLNTAAPTGEPGFTGWCLERHDLCVSKLCAGREKDFEFVQALVDQDLVDATEIMRRLSVVDSRHSGAVRRATNWLSSLAKHSGRES